MSTKYNVLFNGHQALSEGLQELNENFEDNYWEVLPIEPMTVDELEVPDTGLTEGPQTPFDKAEEKAVKAVQKHSMVITRQERNPQIDDAYLLLGKARYYSKRFVPALEAFNFVILNYPGAKLIQETKIWQSKTLIRLQNEEQAIENLNALLKGSSIEEETVESAHTALAMAYESLGNTEALILNLEKAVAFSNNIEQTARNLFVLGQLYSLNDETENAMLAFDRIIELRKAPFKYKIHAHIEKAKIADTAERQQQAQEVLNALIKDRDNRPYLDELYYHVGRLVKEKSTEQALEYYNLSLRTELDSDQQRGLSYEAIGNLYFDNADFLTAGAYYDSILSIADNTNSKRIRRLARKRANLNEVILYEKTLKNNDSILNLTSMSNDERIAYFNAHIENLKAEEVKLQEQPKKNTGFFNFGRGNTATDENSGKWYFYNVQTVGFGTQEFERIWGNRPHEDNWRLSNKTQINFGGSRDSRESNISFDNAKKYELDYYLERIPSDPEVLNILINERNNAYYKLGLIYKEQFGELDLARQRLSSLLEANPKENLKIPATYHLYKTYEALDSPEAETYKNIVISDYKDSKYAQIILSPTEFIEDQVENAPETAYAAVFYEYKDGLYNEVVEKTSAAIVKFEGQAIVPKFELLKAYALGKRDGLQAFKEALEFVAMNYPNTEEGAKALEVIETIKTKI